MSFPSDLEIARGVTPRPIIDVARDLGIADSELELYGPTKAKVTLEAIQIMGGNGYMREYHVEMLMRDAKLLQIGGGADEIQIITIARHLLKDGVPA